MSLHMKYGYCADDVPTTVTDVFAAADESLVKRVLTNLSK